MGASPGGASVAASTMSALLQVRAFWAFFLVVSKEKCPTVGCSDHGSDEEYDTHSVSREEVDVNSEEFGMKEW